MSIFIIGEIGINHNGDIETCKKLIHIAFKAGFDAVKFQKRDINLVYTQDFLDAHRESPWGTTQREQKLGLEFTEEQYLEINQYCEDLGIDWFASAWDLASQKFLQKFDWIMSNFFPKVCLFSFLNYFYFTIYLLCFII